MINFLLGLLLGALPDCLYYFVLEKEIKRIKTKKIILFILILLSYVIFNMILRYNFYLYLLYDISLYIILKILYKSQIPDFFVVITIDLYLLLINTLCFFLFKDNYIIALIACKTLIFIPLIFKNKLNKLYNKYLSLWNRTKDIKRPIKSLTLRNISLMILNVSIVGIYLILVYIVGTLK